VPVRSYVESMTFPERFTEALGRMGRPAARPGHPSVTIPVRDGRHPRWAESSRPYDSDSQSEERRPRAEPEPAAAVPSAPEVPKAPSDTSGDEERLREALRELEASRRRVERDAQQVNDEARAGLIQQLFPVLDGLDRAVGADSGDTALARGVELVRSQFEQVLVDYGLERIASVGQRFDPAQHEAVSVVRVGTDAEHGMVLQEWEAGYRFAGRVLRAAKVAVGKRH